ncbi:MAG: hypothetical protein J6A35_00965 [Paludibacteraceae bacterium]|nr:hypothetical protein [Paludibacteraceae bacterium]
MSTKYEIESANWCTYSHPDYLSAPLNMVYKTLIERGVDVKYIKSETQYSGDKMIHKSTRENINNMDIRWQEYPAGNEARSRDTIIWYDIERTKVLEEKSKQSIRYNQYDNNHREISSKIYWWGKLTHEYTYTYSHLTRYGEYKNYAQHNDELMSVQYDTTVFVDNSFSQPLSWKSKQINYFDDTYTYYFTSEKNEYVAEGISRKDGVVVYQNVKGEVVTNRSYTVEYTWQDALNNTYRSEDYQNGILVNKSEGYTKYVQ